MKKDILDVLKQSIDIFYQNDADLIRRDVQEQTISGRLAHYLENIIQNYAFYKIKGCSVDVEYNRNFEDSKKIYSKCNGICSDCFIKKEADVYKFDRDQNKCTPYQYTQKYQEGKDCRPDIIIHKRNSNDNNLLVIEVKKSESLIIGEKIKDYMKLSSFTCQKFEQGHAGDFVYKYLLGCFIEFKNESCEIDLFENANITGKLTYDATARTWEAE